MRWPSMPGRRGRREAADGTDDGAAPERRGERAFASHGWWRVATLVAGVAAFAILHTMSAWPGALVLLEAAVALLFLAPAWKPASLWIGGEFVAALAWWWLRGAHASLWWAVALAACLAVQLVAVAWSAEAPPWASYAPGIARRRLRTAGAFWAVCALAVALVAGVAWMGRYVGPVAVAVGAAALVAALIYAVAALRRASD